MPTTQLEHSSVDVTPYHIEPGSDVRLDDYPTHEQHLPIEKADGKKLRKKLTRRLAELQELLYAEGKQSVLAVLQAMDAGGKDSTTRHVFGPLNPQGCKVVSYKAPNSVELAHDFLWRIHQGTPRHGYIALFNRSHYEDVLIVAVKNLAPESVWSRRYDHINNFERMLHDEGTRIVKFFLHISPEYQKKRLQRRLDRPDKLWKCNPDDLAERKRWDKYQHAYETVLSRCSTDHAPWYVIPAERKWWRDLLVAQTLVNLLESMDMHYPQPAFNASDIVVE
jgi:PPK2 family polyphosphate:nucleotide phosphotransferase